MFDDVVTSEAELRALYRQPGDGALRKQIAALDDNCRAFIAHSPLLFLASSGPDGSCDVSPKGGPPGFVRVLDSGRLAIPDLAGNNRLDSMVNLVAGGGGVGLLFVIPGLDETLRVNGRAWLVRDKAVLDACEVAGRRPRLAVGVAVDEAFIHCAKAFRRSAAWSPADWPDRAGLPSVGCMLRDHMGMDGVTGDQIGAYLEDGYAKTLWEMPQCPPSNATT